ncbi:MAG: hypothetical protein AAGA48_19465 [Myxococcota bacterium]
MQSRVVVWVTEEPKGLANPLVDSSDHLYAIDVWCGAEAAALTNAEAIWCGGWPPPRSDGMGPHTRVIAVSEPDTAFSRLREWTETLPAGVSIDLVLDGPLSSRALWSVTAWLCVERPDDRLRVHGMPVEIPRLRRLLRHGSSTFMQKASYKELLRVTKADATNARAELHRCSRGWTYHVFDVHGEQFSIQLSDVLGAALCALVRHPGAPPHVVVAAASAGELGWSVPSALDDPEAQAGRVRTWASRLRHLLKGLAVRGLSDFVPALHSYRVVGDVEITFADDLPWIRTRSGE